MRLEPFLSPDLTAIIEHPPSRDSVLTSITRLAHPRLTKTTPEMLMSGFLDRESKYPTGTPEGIAFPHVLLPEIEQSMVAVVTLKPGIKWSTQQHPPQDLIFAIFGNADTPWEHVRLLARLARIARGTGILEQLRAAATSQDIYHQLVMEDRRHG